MVRAMQSFAWIFMQPYGILVPREHLIGYKSLKNVSTVCVYKSHFA